MRSSMRGIGQGAVVRTLQHYAEASILARDFEVSNVTMVTGASVLRALSNSSLQLRDEALQFSGQPVGMAALEFVSQGTVIPKSAITPAAEPLPNHLAEFVIVSKDAADVVHFVRG